MKILKEQYLKVFTFTVVALISMILTYEGLSIVIASKESVSPDKVQENTRHNEYQFYDNLV